MVLCTGCHRSTGQQKKAGALLRILICLSLISFMAISAQAATTPQVSAGASSDGTGSNAHTLALRSDGTVWAWGDNTYDQLGQGSSSTLVNSTEPVAVTRAHRDLHCRSCRRRTLPRTQERRHGLGMGPKQLWPVGGYSP